MKKIIVIIMTIIMVVSFAGFTARGTEATVLEEFLRANAFVRDESDDSVWRLEYVDPERVGEYDYAITNVVYYQEYDILEVTIIGIDTYRNLIYIAGGGIGHWDSEEEDFVFDSTWGEV